MPVVVEETVYISCELLYGTKAKWWQFKLSADQKLENEKVKEDLETAAKELSFVSYAQPFLVNDRRRSHVILILDKEIVKILKNRHLIAAKFFENDQIYFKKLIEDYKASAVEEYRNLRAFIWRIEEDHAQEAFCVLFGLEYIDDGFKTEQELMDENFIRRKFPWVNSGKETCLNNALTHYNDWKFAQDESKRKLIERYGGKQPKDKVDRIKAAKRAEAEAARAAAAAAAVQPAAPRASSFLEKLRILFRP